MAHSTREKDRAARGGKTKHQAAKIRRNASGGSFDPQARIKELENWQRGLEEARANKGPKVVVGVKVKHINMWPSTIERRKGALGRLLAQLVSKEKPVKGNRDSILLSTTHLTEQDVIRIGQEIKTLKARI